MIDLPTRARMSRARKRLWVRALQRADHEADALSSEWRGCRRCADIDEREVIASRRGRAIERDPIGERQRVPLLRWQRTRQPHCERAAQ
jgi:hypothetical protein